MTLPPGTRLGPYEIGGLLGAGGMGEVYRARDPRLGRDVAIKVLPSDVAEDADRLRRFRLEGQAASALNHPNLLTVYDADVEHGVAYLVTELLEGATLRERLLHGPLPLRSALLVAAELSHGLAAAHEGGIVHRDLKPENIFLTRDERVKILDFGLARPVVPITAGGTAVHTRPGFVVGTVGYMAPEQVEGAAADHRSDLFSLGCVLHEMVTGQRAFERATPIETMMATLRDDPPVIGSVDGRPLPAALAPVMRRCLEKKPGQRFQSASDLAFQLETVRALLSTGGPEVSQVVAHSRPASRRARLATGAAGAALTALFFAWHLSKSPPKSPPGQASVPQPRTTFLTFSGHDTAPDASADGSTVVFTSIRDGVPRVWLKQLSTSEEVALTTGPDRFPRLSPDGATLLFTRLGSSAAQAGSGATASALYRMPVVGGPPRKVVDAAEAGDWSPDGSEVVFTRVRQGEQAVEWLLVVAAIDGGGERVIGAASAQPLVSPRWSPDGRTLVVTRSGRLMGVADELEVVDLASGNRRPLPRASKGVVSAPAFSRDGHEIFYAQSQTVTAYVPQSRLVAQRLDTGELRTLAWVPNQVTTVDVLHDGALVIDGLFLRQGLREIPLHGTGASHWLTRGSAVDRQPVYSADGQWVTFSSSRSGDLDLWTVAPQSGMVRRLTEDAADDWDPASTRDGRSLLWSSNQGGHFEVWVADADGRRARQLSHDGADAQNPTADAQGRFVTYVSGAPGRLGLWRIAADGSDPRQLVAGTNTMSPEISPDGKYVLFHTPPDPGWCEIRVVALADGRQIPFHIRFDVPGIPVALSARPRSIGRARWLPNGRAIAFIGVSPQGSPGLYVQDFSPGRDTSASRRPLLILGDDEAPESFGISPDGSRVTVSMVEQSPALLVIDDLATVTAASGRPQPPTP
jgi:serine/threonine protein kinase